MHGRVDGCKRLPVYLRAGTKNTAATVPYPNNLACSEAAPDEAIRVHCLWSQEETKLNLHCHSQ